MRLIDADALIEKYDLKGRALTIIDNEPTVERPKGKWELTSFADNADIRCSRCGCIAFYYHRTPFCPGCGAEMEV